MSTTFNETRFDFGAEVQRLEGELDDINDKLDALDADEEEADDTGRQRQVLSAQRQQLQTQLKGVKWARGYPADDDREGAYADDEFPMWDQDVDGVVLAAPRSNAYGTLQDDLEQDPNAGSGTSGNMLVAEGTVEAPYAADSLSNAELAGVVGQLHPFFTTWAKARIEALLDPDQGNVTSSGTSPPDESVSET